MRSDGTVSARTRRALAAVEESGADLVLVTGRPPRWMGPIVAATGHRGVCVCANGAVVFDLHTETVVRHSLLAPADAAAVVSALRRELPGITFAVEHSESGFAHEPAYRPRWDSADPRLVRPLPELVETAVVKLLARHDSLDADELLAAARRAVGVPVTMTHSSADGLLEISAAGVSKATALARLAADRDVEAADVIAFGDMPNDLPMLRWAGYPVAVANAHADVLAVAREVTASNDDDGVAQVLERWF